MAFEPAMPLADLWSGELKPCRLAGRKVLLLRIGEEVRAYEDRCAHLGLPLSDGLLEGTVLTCAAHHYQYDALTGVGVNPRAVCLAEFPVKVERGEIHVEVRDLVGPVLEASDTGRAVLEAIRRTNPEATVLDRGSYLRVLVPGRCVVRREAIEEVLGRAFALPGDLERVMPSFKGAFRVSEAEAVWSFERP